VDNPSKFIVISADIKEMGNTALSWGYVQLTMSSPSSMCG